MTQLEIRSSLVGLALFGALLFAACGSDVVEPPASSGTASSAGAGGAAASSVTATASHSASATSTASGAGGAGGVGGAGGQAASSTVSAAVIGASAGTGADCYDIESCGDPGTGCVGCAYAVFCNAAFTTCLGSDPCYQFGQCMDGCAGTAAECEATCAGLHPDGYDDYVALAECVLCQACGPACAGQTDWACR